MTAPDMEAPGEVGTEGRAQGKVGSLDCASADACRAERDAADKRFHGLRARAALAGIALYVIGNDGRAEYLAARWGWTKPFTNIDAFEAWLDRVEGRS